MDTMISFVHPYDACLDDTYLKIRTSRRDVKRSIENPTKLSRRSILSFLVVSNDMTSPLVKDINFDVYQCQRDRLEPY